MARSSLQLKFIEYKTIYNQDFLIAIKNEISRKLTKKAIVVSLLLGQLVAAYRARVVVFKPWLKTIRVERMRTWHKHCFVTYLDIIGANWAHGTF